VCTVPIVTILWSVVPRKNSHKWKFQLPVSRNTDHHSTIYRTQNPHMCIGFFPCEIDVSSCGPDKHLLAIVRFEFLGPHFSALEYCVQNTFLICCCVGVFFPHHCRSDAVHIKDGLSRIWAIVTIKVIPLFLIIDVLKSISVCKKSKKKSHVFWPFWCHCVPWILKSKLIH